MLRNCWSGCRSLGLRKVNSLHGVIELGVVRANRAVGKNQQNLRMLSQSAGHRTQYSPNPKEISATRKRFPDTVERLWSSTRVLATLLRQQREKFVLKLAGAAGGPDGKGHQCSDVNQHGGNTGKDVPTARGDSQ